MMDRPEVERFVREADVQPTCACASRHCGPHRCWPSWISWIGLGVGLVYVVLMHSFYLAERADQQGAFHETLQQSVEARITQRLTAFQSEVGQEIRQRLDTSHGTVDAQVKAVNEQLRRAQELTWALATPEIERDLELRQAIRQVQEDMQTLRTH